MNAIRSPMAEFLARDLYGRRLFTQSAGVHAGEPDPFAHTVMAERGVPIERHVPHTLDQLNDSYYDLIVTLSPEAHHRALQMAKADAVDIEYWPTQDPFQCRRKSRTGTCSL